MIGIINKHLTFAAPVSYNTRKRESAPQLYSNLHATSRHEMIRELEGVAARNPNVRRPALHVVISLADGERLTDKQFRIVLQRYIEEMGFSRCQYVAWRHTDEDHEHIHVVINRVTPTGRTVSDSYDFRRQEKVMRSLEEQLGLRKVKSSKSMEISDRRRRVSKIEKAVGTIWRVTRLSRVIHEVVDAEAPASFSQLEAKLAERGVEMRLCSVQGKARYIFYSFEGQTYNARNVDAASSLRGLQARGIYFPWETPVRQPSRIKTLWHRSIKLSDFAIDSSALLTSAPCHTNHGLSEKFSEIAEGMKR